MLIVIFAVQMLCFGPKSVFIYVCRKVQYVRLLRQHTAVKNALIQCTISNLIEKNFFNKSNLISFWFCLGCHFLFTRPHNNISDQYFFFKSNMNFYLMLIIATSLLLIMCNMTAGNTFAKYEAKHVTINSWTVSSSVSGKRSVVYYESFLLFDILSEKSHLISIKLFSIFSLILKIDCVEKNLT
jgi:hypothetical protein